MKSQCSLRFDIPDINAYIPETFSQLSFLVDQVETKCRYPHVSFRHEETPSILRVNDDFTSCLGWGRRPRLRVSLGFKYRVVEGQKV